MSSGTYAFLALSLVPIGRLNAQAALPLETGQRVRVSYDCRTRTPGTGVVRTDCRKEIGTLARVGRDTVVLTVGQSTKRHALSAIATLEVGRGRRSHWLAGAVIGAPVGAGAGLGILSIANGGWICGDYEIGGLCLLAAAAGVAGGALLGALVGARVKTEHWQQVPVDHLRGIGVSRAGTVGAVVTLPFSLRLSSAPGGGG